MRRSCKPVELSLLLKKQRGTGRGGAAHKGHREH